MVVHQVAERLLYRPVAQVCLSVIESVVIFKKLFGQLDRGATGVVFDGLFEFVPYGSKKEEGKNRETRFRLR